MLLIVYSISLRILLLITNDRNDFIHQLDSTNEDGFVNFKYLLLSIPTSNFFFYRSFNNIDNDQTFFSTIIKGGNFLIQIIQFSALLQDLVNVENEHF